MKSLNNSPLRSLFAILLGLFLVIWPELAVDYLVIGIGILFVIPGIIGILGYFLRDKKNEILKPIFPVEGAGSIFLGILLIAMPSFFVSILMYVLGILLIFAGIQLFFPLIEARKRTNVPIGFYVLPALILLSGLFIIFYPFETAANTFWLFGIVSLVYGVMELFYWYKFRKAADEVSD